jgi:putative ABC transport system permease protein
VEVALAIAVTIAAGLIARSFVQLSSVDVGFRAQNAFALTVPDLPPARYPTPESRLRFVRRLANSLKHLPGVRETAIAEDVPFQDTDMSTFTLPNRPSVHNLVKSFGVSREFFATLGVPLLRGRTFSENDRSGSSPVAIVNAAFARKYFGGLDVTQKQLRLDRSIPVDASPPVRTIVGIVGDVRETLSSEPSPTIYVPIAQLPSPNSIVIRTAGRDAALANEASRKTQQLDPMLPDPQLVSLPSLIADDANSARLALILFCVLGSIALLLAALGIYGVSSYSVMKRVQDFGIRMAIGAHQTQIIRLVVVAALQSSLVGIVFGVMLSALTATFTSTLLFGVSPYDMRTFAAAILLALICTLLSSIVPALRASRLDPCAALRYE